MHPSRCRKFDLTPFFPIQKTQIFQRLNIFLNNYNIILVTCLKIDREEIPPSKFTLVNTIESPRLLRGGVTLEKLGPLLHRLVAPTKQLTHHPVCCSTKMILGTTSAIVSARTVSKGTKGTIFDGVQCYRRDNIAAPFGEQQQAEVRLYRGRVYLITGTRSCTDNIIASCYRDHSNRRSV